VVEKISKEEATEEVLLITKRMAKLYLHFSEVIIEKLGEKEGKELIKKAVNSYGSDCGEEVKDKAIEKGLTLEPKNYSKIPDLPKLGWESEKINGLDNSTEGIKVTFCPLADYWIKENKEDIGRIYCNVDQAKYKAFNPEIVCIHEKNTLEGDFCCHIIAKKS